MFKKLLFTLLFFQLYSSFTFAVEDTYWDLEMVRSYVHNSELQRRWAMAFLASKLHQLNGEEQILDIGCGDGKVTADISKFVPQGSIMGIDPSSAMYEWASKQYCKEEYPNLAFRQGGFLEPNVTGPYDILIANCSLQHCQDQTEAFEKMKKLLKPSGKLWIMIPALDNDAMTKARKSILAAPKWSCYIPKYPPRKFLQLDEYVALLKKSGFIPIRVEKVKTSDPFVDREDLIQFFLGTFIPVNSGSARDFFNEVIDEYLRLLPEAMHPNGVIETRFSRIEIEAVR